jgi:two-component system sensor histidine kinase FlrB
VASVSIAEQITSPSTSKLSPLIKLKRRQETQSGSELIEDDDKNINLLASRVDQLNQQLTALQCENQREQQHNESLAEQLQAIVEVMPAGVVLLDNTGRVCQCNDIAESLLAKQLLGQRWRDISQTVFKRRIDDGHEISTVTGKRLSILTRAVSGSKCGQVILINDMTQTRDLQAKLSQKNRLSAMGKMVSALAHQIRTPLSAAILYSSHLRADTLDEQQTRDFSHKLHSRLEHLDRQVRDMLLFVKGELPLNDSVTGQQLIDDLTAAAEGAAQAGAVQLSLEADMPRLYTRCNRDALVNAIMNLVNNATQAYESSDIKAPARKVQVIISAAQSRDGLTVAVRDFGPGIEPGLLEKLDEPFITTKSQGTGLGLAVVRAVAHAHGGSFSIENVQPGVLAKVMIPARFGIE